ncbi:MAG TPA: 50S ribosomal protein L23 [Candidatus Paceibacterota bacterium]|nr:50S ribosomal protein L23 [Candidatus Paceibacterota bacterium]
MAIFSSAKKDSEKKAAKRVARARMPAHGAAHDIIRAPWFSEKALIATEKGVYAFVVPPRATKADIAGAIQSIYNVKPRAVRIVNLPGKAKALRARRGEGRRAARRKAYVYLNAGDSIQFA